MKKLSNDHRGYCRYHNERSDVLRGFVLSGKITRPLREMGSHDTRGIQRAEAKADALCLSLSTTISALLDPDCVGCARPESEAGHLNVGLCAECIASDEAAATVAETATIDLANAEV